MEKYNLHKKSLELLDQLIASNPEVLNDLMKKHENTITGPTFNEYLCSLNESEDLLVDYIQCEQKDEWAEFIKAEPIAYYSPPQYLLKNKNKKKALYQQSLSFFV